jgi:hypothetical protein
MLPRSAILPTEREDLMKRLLRARLAVAACAVTAAGLLMAAPAMGAVPSTSYSGTTSDGGSWVADVPASWNGILLIYSHGFGAPAAQDAPDPNTQEALLRLGYAMAGSSYDPNGSWWALGSALRDQFETITDVEADLPSTPTHVIAFGTSMGGLISALEDENSDGRIDGALTTCGIVAGGIQLNNYQLDGEYAISQLLAQGQQIKLVHFTSPTDGLTTGGELSAVAQQAQSTAAGRARLALAMAFMNVSTWAPGATMPAPTAYTKQEEQQYAIEFAGSFNTMDFVEFGRYYIELAAGGNGGWDANVNFQQLLDKSPYAPEVRALYRAAGLSLKDDLSNLTANANIHADPSAIQWLDQTSVPTGNLQVPELDMHTISDQLVPVQQENYYRHTVAAAGDSRLLRQAFVRRQLHCNFSPSELAAGVLAITHRVVSGDWNNVAEPASLEAVARSLDFGDRAEFIPFQPWRLSGDNGPFNPNIDDTVG